MKNKISGLLKSITIIFDHIIFATKTSRKRLLSFFIIIFATYIIGVEYKKVYSSMAGAEQKDYSLMHVITV